MLRLSPDCHSQNQDLRLPFLLSFKLAAESTGTEDDQDELDDERDDENEAPQRETIDTTEAPEEFVGDEADEDDVEA